MNYFGADNSDFVSHGIYLSSGKLLIVIAIVAIMVIAAYHLGRESKDEGDKK